MGRPVIRGILAALIVAMAAAPPAHGARAAATQRPSALAQALALVPAKATIVSFTDWSAIKAAQGAMALTGASPMAAKLAFLRNLNRNQAAAAGFGVDYLSQMRALWSYDTFDLQWEAGADGAGPPPLSMLRFSDSFNLAPVLAHFTERHYARTNYRGVALYTHAMDFRQSWIVNAAGLFGMLNAAYMPQRHLLVISSAPAAVKAAIDAYVGAVSPAFDATASAAAALGPMESAILMPLGSGCPAVGAAALTGGHPSKDVAAAQKKVHSYTALGIGYRNEAGHPLGVAVLHFASPALAAADLPVRRTLAATGVSLYTHQPYAKSVFTVMGVKAAGSDLIFQLRPVHDHPVLLFQMVYVRDMLFALCP